MFFRRRPRWQLLNDGQAIGGLGAPHELQGDPGRAPWGSKGAERRPPPLQKRSWRSPCKPKWTKSNKLQHKLQFQNRAKTGGFFVLFWNGGFAWEGAGDQRKENMKVGRLKGGIGMCSGDRCGHNVPSEKAMRCSWGPLVGPRMVPERK